MPAIGIDLGTTYSCVAVFQHGKVEIIANELGNRTTPSIVAFTDTERLVGDAAKNQAPLNPENTIYAAKRLIGRKFNEANIKNDIKHWQFKVTGTDEKIKIHANFKEEEQTFSPEDISSAVLTYLKQTAEAYLGETIQDAIITVPAYFNDSQRQATQDAGKIAKLNVLRIINEPTAAALAYGLDKNEAGEKNILIFDLGGGTFDVSILTLADSSTFDVLSTCGNTHLGGEDFDNILVDYFADEFKRTNDKDLSENKKALRILRNEAEKAKRSLSSNTEANIEIDNLHDGIDFYSKITRAKFEDLCIEQFKLTLEPVRQALIDAKLEANDIQEVILVGGSTRIPKVQSLLQEFFNGKTLNHSVNPDEAVAYGAAIQAAILSGDMSPNIKSFLLLDIVPLSLGIQTAGGVMTKIIDRNSKIPCMGSEMVTTQYDNQTEFTIQVFEGERSLTKDNNLLGYFVLSGIPQAPCGEPSIEVTVEVDANGILNASAKEMSTGNSKAIVIKSNKGRLTQKEIDRKIVEAEKYKADDEKQRQVIVARNVLEVYIHNVKQIIQTSDNKLSKNEKDKGVRLCNEGIGWIENNAGASKEDYEKKLIEIKKICEPILSKIRGNNENPENNENNEEGGHENDSSDEDVD